MGALTGVKAVITTKFQAIVLVESGHVFSRADLTAEIAFCSEDLPFQRNGDVQSLDRFDDLAPSGLLANVASGKLSYVLLERVTPRSKHLKILCFGTPEEIKTLN